jgi:hypothetical protein
MSYFITAIAYYPGEPKYDPPYRCTRTFGHYGTQIDAEIAIEENRCDMHECLYNFIVLEEIGYGIHTFGDNQSWFRWSDRKRQWVGMKKPKWAKGTLNWAIG